jgi:hypothetical protein
MDDDPKLGCSPDQLRDRIFQTRLQIEKFRLAGEVDLLKRAEDNLRIMLRALQSAESVKIKPRAK